MPQSSAKPEIVEGAFCPLPFPVVRWLMIACAAGALFIPITIIGVVVNHWVLPVLDLIVTWLLVLLQPVAVAGAYLYFAIRHRSGSPRTARHPSWFTLVGTLVFMAVIWIASLTTAHFVMLFSGLYGGLYGLLD